MRRAAARNSALYFSWPLLGVVILGGTERRYQINPGQDVVDLALLDNYDVDRDCVVKTHSCRSAAWNQMGGS